MFLFFHRFHDKETENAVGRGEAVSFWGGRPLGREPIGNRMFGLFPARLEMRSRSRHDSS